MQYDVIVVGAGPGGSTSARELASRGLSVLMIDKAEFPRDKPCGGGVTVRCANTLDLDLSHVIERAITRITITRRRGREFQRESPTVITYMTQRSRLDAFLAEQAVEAGATFIQREGVKSVERRRERVTVRTGKRAYDGRALVAADGANGNTAKMAGISTQFIHGIALEGNITPNKAFPTKWESTMGVDFSGLPGGYGWIFPKGDHLNIGLGGWKHIGPKLRHKLHHLVEFYGFDPADLWGVRGHHLPIRSKGSQLVDGNVLLVGDAAGALDPLTAEGIYGAIWTGQAAAAHLSQYLDGKTSNLDGYRKQVERQLLPELTIGRQFHDIFYLWPNLFVGLEERTSILWREVERLLKGEDTYVTVARKLGRIWPVLEFVSDSARVLPPLRRMSGLPPSFPPERFFRRDRRHETAT